MRLLHIVPRVPPAVCGVGDYAWNLAGALEAHEGIPSALLSAGTTWTDPGPGTHHPCHRLPRPDAAALTAWLRTHTQPGDALLLHLSPYGYQKRALPFWLARAWERAACELQHLRRATYFHELFASGPPTTSAFWLQPLQKAVLRRIARVTGVRLTNREPYARWLDLAAPADAPTRVTPVFSNLGELAAPPPLVERAPEMVLFASANHSGTSTPELVSRAAESARRLGLTRLHVIGAKEPLPQGQAGMGITTHGYLTAEAASELLSRCRAGYTAYTPAYLGKSGLFACFASHGLAVVVESREQELPDGLAHERNLLAEAFLSTAPSAERLQTLASALHAWYQPHSVRATAAQVATLLRTPALEP